MTKGEVEAKGEIGVGLEVGVEGEMGMMVMMRELVAGKGEEEMKRDTRGR